jgi:hypothetical protein
MRNPVVRAYSTGVEGAASEYKNRSLKFRTVHNFNILYMMQLLLVAPTD